MDSDSQAEEAVRPKGRKSSLAFKTFLVFVGTILLFILIVQVWYFIRESLLTTEVISHGELKKLYMSEGVLIWNESAIPSPADGNIEMLVKAGGRVRLGDSIAEVKIIGNDAGRTPGSLLIRSTRTGVVSTRVDGLEGVLKPDQMDIFAVVAQNMQQAQKSLTVDDQKVIVAEKGKPALKVIDNLSPLTIYSRAPEGFPSAMIKKGGILNTVWNNQEFSGRIADIKNNSGYSDFILQVNSYPTGLLEEKRKFSFALQGESVSGYIVYKKALVNKDGQDGLYIMSKKQAKWVPVKVSGVVNDMAAVSGEQLVPGVRYIVNPRWL